VGASAGSAHERATQPSPPARGAGGAAGESPSLEWSVSPWRERPAAAAGAVVVALGLWLLVLRLLPGERVTATLLGLVGLLSLAPGMAATQCRVDAAGAARRVLFTWERRSWGQIRRARLGRRGLFVSPLERPGRLDRFRGLFLPLPGRAGASSGLEAALRRELDEHGL
jgi:hypothetical protein